jgi:flagellar biosynthesis/type III secretory pathway protein FliH
MAWTGTGADAWAPADLHATIEVPTAAPPPDLLADAYASGFAEGRQVGEEGERARLRTAVRAAEEAIDMVNESGARWTNAAEENLITLSTAIARHIIDRELALDADIIARIVRRALTEFPIDQPVKVRLHPDDLAVIEGATDSGTSSALDQPTRIARWSSDSRVTAGGCVVEGRDRIIDGRVDAALERVYRRLAHHHA